MNHGAGYPMSGPAVSIIIPSYLSSPAQECFLDETLSTVDAQTFADYEVLIVDDGSPADVCAIAGRHARTSVIRQPNGGSAIARNSGIAQARGEYFVFLDADDYLLPTALATGVAALERHPDAGFAVGPREEMTHEGVPVPWQVPRPPPGATHIYEALLGFDWYIIPPSSAMFRRSVVHAVGGFRDPWGADDLDFYLRAAWKFQACCYDDPPVTCYRRYSTSSSRDGERMLHSIRIVYERQWPLVSGDPTLEHAYRRGLNQLVTIFRECLVENVADRLRSREWRRALRSALLLGRERPAALFAAARLTRG